MIDEKRLNQEEKIRAYAEMYARSLIMFGVDVSEKLETATQMSYALNQAYLRGRQDEINRLSKDSKWIPCSERLPIKEYEIDKRNRGESAVYPVLVTMKVFDFEENEEKYLTHEVWFFEWMGELGFYNKDSEKVEAIAWQPLPETYKEGET